MSVVQMPKPPEEGVQGVLDISFPKSKERYKLTSPDLITDMELTDRKKVKGTFEGYVTGASLTFKGDDNEVKWTVTVDRAEIDPA